MLPSVLRVSEKNSSRKLAEQAELDLCSLCAYIKAMGYTGQMHPLERPEPDKDPGLGSSAYVTY